MHIPKDETQITLARLILDPPAPGPWNMAVDEVLAESAAERGQCTLRFYRWSEPTLSLGYFQPSALRAQHAASARVTVVRRASGGGAIVHDRELTYSLAVPVAHPLASDPMRLYSAVHGSLIDALAQAKIAACQIDAPPGLPPNREPFLCFSRRAKGDVFVGNAKICGSAQRRRRGAIVQHGSVLLQRSPAAPELPGLAELAGFELDFQSLQQAWQPLLAGRIGLGFQPGSLTPWEIKAAESLVRVKYATDSWTHRK